MRRDDSVARKAGGKRGSEGSRYLLWIFSIVESSKEKETLASELEASKDEASQLEMELSDVRADLLKLQGEEGVLATELKQVLTCLQQYYVENEVLKKGVLQLGGDEVLTKLLTSSKDVRDQLYTTKPKSKPS